MRKRRANAVRERAARYGAESQPREEPPTEDEAKAIERGRRAVHAGDYLTLDELRNDLARPRRIPRRKSPSSRTSR